MCEDVSVASSYGSGHSYVAVLLPGPRPAKDKSHDILRINPMTCHDIGFPSHKANLMTFCVKCHDIGVLTFY